MFAIEKSNNIVLFKQIISPGDQKRVDFLKDYFIYLFKRIIYFNDIFNLDDFQLESLWNFA